MAITRIRKRDGSLERFEQSKITHAIHRALFDAKLGNGRTARRLSDQVVKLLSARYIEKIPGVEDVQDTVVEVLGKWNRKAAKVYQEYRAKKAALRATRARFGIEEKLTYNAMAVLERRYLLRNERGKIIETPGQMFRRVARAIASVERLKKKEWEEKFFNLMSRLEFLPNSPTMFNAGAPLGQLSACFVLPIEDSLVSIFDAVKQTALIEQSGGGVGFSFSRLRPAGDIVRSTMGVASGPVSFMRIFDTVTDVIKAGGKRRGAMMGSLRVDHPDIMRFITAKSGEGVLKNFNISVAVTDRFMAAVKKDKDYNLINPRTGKAVKKLNARKVWNAIVQNAWKTGDPGVLFIDEINRKNPTSHIGLIETTNPCIPKHIWVMTGDGPRQVSDIINKSVDIALNGKAYPTKGFFKTCKRNLFKIITKEGLEVEATANHLFLRADKITRYKIYSNWVKLGELGPGDKLILSEHNGGWDGKHSQDDGYLIGLLFGDGTISKKAILYSWSTDKGSEGVRKAVTGIVQKLKHRNDFKGWVFSERDKRFRLSLAYIDGVLKELGVERKMITPSIEKESRDFYIGFLRGVFDADGSVQGSQKKGVSIRLSQSDLEFLKAVQRMLLRIGILSKIYKNRRPEKFTKLPDGRGGRKNFRTKAQHELVISNKSIFKFWKLIGFKNAEKRKRLKTLLKNYKRVLNRDLFVATIERIVSLGREDVFDIRVPGISSFDANGFLVHNCGEVCLHPYESCNLGSINLTKMLKKGPKGYAVDWKKLRKTVRLAVRFLDNVIDANKYPIPRIEKATKANRRIGLGVMGFADMLIMMGIRYDSEKAVKVAEKIMKFISEESHRASQELGKEKGSFPNFKGSKWEKRGYKWMRNATTTVIAPTGTLSIIAGCSSGIEPLFAVSFVRRVLEGRELLEVNRIFEQLAKKRGFYSTELMLKIAKAGSVQGIKEVPADIRKLFVTALDIRPEWHVKMQAAFQKYTDNSVSKTINLPKNAKVGNVKRAFELAYKLKCKGITVYRYGSKREQVLYIKKKRLVAEPEYSGGCPTRLCPMPS